MLESLKELKDIVDDAIYYAPDDGTEAADRLRYLLKKARNYVLGLMEEAQ